MRASLKAPPCPQLLAHDAWERAGRPGRKPSKKRAEQAEPKDEQRRLELLLGREDVAKFQRAFDRVDTSREGELGVDEVGGVGCGVDRAGVTCLNLNSMGESRCLSSARRRGRCDETLAAWGGLGRRAARSDLLGWLKGRGGGGRKTLRSLDLLSFVKAFAGIFHAPPPPGLGLTPADAGGPHAKLGWLMAHGGTLADGLLVEVRICSGRIVCVGVR